MHRVLLTQSYTLCFSLQSSIIFRLLQLLIYQTWSHYYNLLCAFISLLFPVYIFLHLLKNFLPSFGMMKDFLPPRSFFFFSVYLIWKLYFFIELHCMDVSQFIQPVDTDGDFNQSPTDGWFSVFCFYIQYCNKQPFTISVSVFLSFFFFRMVSCLMIAALDLQIHVHNL